MADSPLSIIFEMVLLLIGEAVSTFVKISALYGRLLESLGIVASVGGPLGTGLSLAILAVVGFFVAKLFLGGGIKLLILIPVAIILLYLIVLGAVL